MKLVKFDNGKYGVRMNWFFGWHFKCLTGSGVNWSEWQDVLRFCQGTKEQALRVMKGYKLKYKIVKEDDDA